MEAEGITHRAGGVKDSVTVHDIRDVTSLSRATLSLFDPAGHRNQQQSDSVID